MIVTGELSNKGSEVLKYPEISSPLKCKKMRIGALEIWVLKTFWSFKFFIVLMQFLSSTKCPQGGFSINLKSTGFKISSKQRWKLKGNGGHMEMWRPSSGQEIRARCGGFCARCQPTHANTIQLEFNDL